MIHRYILVVHNLSDKCCKLQVPVLRFLHTRPSSVRTSVCTSLTREMLLNFDLVSRLCKKDTILTLTQNLMHIILGRWNGHHHHKNAIDESSTTTTGSTKVLLSEFVDVLTSR